MIDLTVIRTNKMPIPPEIPCPPVEYLHKHLRIQERGIQVWTTYHPAWLFILLSPTTIQQAQRRPSLTTSATSVRDPTFTHLYRTCPRTVANYAVPIDSIITDTKMLEENVIQMKTAATTTPSTRMITFCYLQDYTIDKGPGNVGWMKYLPPPASYYQDHNKEYTEMSMQSIFCFTYRINHPNTQHKSRSNILDSMGLLIRNHHYHLLFE